MATLFFALSVVSLPLLLDRGANLISAIASLLALWAAVIAAAPFAGLLPLFLGRFVVLPVFGHASWHLYRRLLPPEG